MTDKKWYAVYTMPRWEKKVAAALNKYKIENYCPLNRVVKQWADRKKVVYEPLFTSYVFVNINEKENLTIRKTDGILNFVYWLGKPAVIKYEEIAAIKSFLENYSNVYLEKTVVNINDKVRILNGALIHSEGYVLNRVNSKVKILLPSMGYAICTDLNTIKVEVLARASKALVNS